MLHPEALSEDPIPSNQVHRSLNIRRLDKIAFIFKSLTRCLLSCSQWSRKSLDMLYVDMIMASLSFFLQMSMLFDCSYGHRVTVPDRLAWSS